MKYESDLTQNDHSFEINLLSVLVRFLPMVIDHNPGYKS